MKRISTKSKRVHLYFSSDVYEKLRNLSLILDKSLSLLVSELLLLNSKDLLKEVENEK